MNYLNLRKILDVRNITDDPKLLSQTDETTTSKESETKEEDEEPEVNLEEQLENIRKKLKRDKPKDQLQLPPNLRYDTDEDREEQKKRKR